MVVSLHSDAPDVEQFFWFLHDKQVVSELLGFFYPKGFV